MDISCRTPDNLRILCRQQRLAGVGRDRVQPDPRRRDHRVGVSCQGHHRDHPHAADRGPGPRRHLGQTAGTAGKDCSTRPADHQPQQRPDHPAPPGATKDPSGKAGQTGGFLTHPIANQFRIAKTQDQNRANSLADGSTVDRGWSSTVRCSEKDRGLVQRGRGRCLVRRGELRGAAAAFGR